jgi:PKD repeat protein
MVFDRGGRRLAVSVAVTFLAVVSIAVPSGVFQGSALHDPVPASPVVSATAAASARISTAPAGVSHLPSTPHPSIALTEWYNTSAAMNGIKFVTNYSLPPAIENGAMAQDPINVSTGAFINVLFGGYINGSGSGLISNQTWLLYGPGFIGPSVWINATNYTDAPPAVAYPSFSFDPRIPGFVLFGGLLANGSLSNQTWFLNDSTWVWTNYTSTACFFFCPGPRSDASFAFAADSADKTTVLFGGCSDNLCFGAFNDTWELVTFSGSFFWNQLSEVTAPSTRSDSSMTYGGDYLGGLVLFGGCGSTPYTCTLNDTWIFSGGAWTNDTSTLRLGGSPAPPGRGYASMSWINQWGAILLGGGYNDSVLVFNDSWEFTCSFATCAWSNVTGFFGAVDVWGAEMPNNISIGDPMLYGGSSGNTSYSSNTTWVLQPFTSISLSVSNIHPEVNQTFSVNDSLVSGPTPDRAFALWTFSLPGLYFLHTTDNTTVSLPHAGNWFVNGTGIDAYDVGAEQYFVVTVGTPGVASGASESATDIGVVVSFTASAVGQWKAPLNYTWIFGDGHGVSGTNSGVTHSYGASGTFNVTVVQVDGLNNSASHSFPITVHTRPSSGIGTTSTTVEANQTVSFASHVVNGTPSYTYKWNFGDASASGATQNPTHVFASAGNYTVALSVTDAVGVYANSTLSIHVLKGLGATAVANSTSAKVGVPIQFTATASGGSGGTVYSWHLGDGTTSTSASVSHAYSTAGSFTAIVWVNDSAGVSVEKTVAVTITNAGSRPSNPTPASTSSGIPSWIWIVVVLVILAGILGSLLILRGRRRPPTPTASAGPPTAWAEGSTPVPPGALGETGAPGGTPPAK